MAFNKKAVSPLIATVLLISFAVALGAVVMAFGSKTFEENFTNNCQNIDFKITNACYISESQKVKLDILNSGKADIDSMKLWIVGNSVVKNTLEGQIKQGASFSREVEYDSGAFGEIASISVIPSIQKGDQTVWCIDNTANQQKLGSC